MFSRKQNQHNGFGQFRQGPMPQGYNPYPAGQFGQQPYGPGQQMMGDPNLSSMYPSTQFVRLQYEIKENRRRISNLQKRVTRLENYLRIRDTSDYIEEDQIPNEFSL
jgi:hypothetical protein